VSGGISFPLSLAHTDSSTAAEAASQPTLFRCSPGFGGGVGVQRRRGPGVRRRVPPVGPVVGGPRGQRHPDGVHALGAGPRGQPVHGLPDRVLGRQEETPLQVGGVRGQALPTNPFRGAGPRSARTSLPLTRFVVQEMRADFLRQLFGKQHAPPVRTVVQPGAGLHRMLLEAEKRLRRSAGPMQAHQRPADEQQPPDNGVQQLMTATRGELHFPKLRRRRRKWKTKAERTVIR
jgi:hypothetical protein